MLIALSSVPAYLRSGALYSSLAANADDEQEALEDNMISVPQHATKADLCVQDAEELKHLLFSLQFWGADTIPREVIIFALSNNLRDHPTLKEEFARI